ncbi:MAG: hypothetical protein R2824_16045 [Saprospiraceae bacterium]
MAKLKKVNKSLDRKGSPPKENEASNNLNLMNAENQWKQDQDSTKTEKVDTRPLNFKVPNTFRKRFKNFATNNDVTMSELLVICFEQYEKNINQ